jgi:hypothetical protein
METRLAAIDIQKFQPKRNDMPPEVMSWQPMNKNLKMEWWWQQWRTNILVIHCKRIKEKLVELVFENKQYQLEEWSS